MGANGSALTPAELAKLKKVAKDFEAIFINHMLKSMRDTLPKGGILETSQGQKMYEGLMDEEMARSIAGGRGLGLADVLVRDLSRQLGGQKSPGGQKKPSRPAGVVPMSPGDSTTP